MPHVGLLELAISQALCVHLYVLSHCLGIRNLGGPDLTCALHVGLQSL